MLDLGEKTFQAVKTGLLTMSTPFASDCVEQPLDCFGFRILSRVLSVCKA